MSDEMPLFPIPLWNQFESRAIDLSPRDILLCKSSEFFLASTSDTMWSDSLPTFQNQVGLRCSYCAKEADISSSIIFPVTVEDVAHCLRRLCDHHFLKCPSMPYLPPTNDLFDKVYFQRLIDYCSMKCKSSDIIERYPPSSGLAVRKAATSNSVASSALVLGQTNGHQILNSYESQSKLLLKRKLEDETHTSQFSSNLGHFDSQSIASFKQLSKRNAADTSSKVDVLASDRINALISPSLHYLEHYERQTKALPFERPMRENLKPDIADGTPLVTDEDDPLISGSLCFLELYERKMLENLKAEGAGAITLLVTDADRPLISDFMFHILKQLRMCTLDERDQKGRGQVRSQMKLGFTGFRCNHCYHRKFFWTHVSRFYNSFSSEVIAHVMSCCPIDIHQNLLTLKNVHSKQMLRSRGSQKLFFERLWSRLHSENQNLNNEDAGSLYLSTHSIQEVKRLSSENIEYEEIDLFSVPGQSGCFSFGSTTMVKCIFLKLSQKNISMKPILLALDEDYLYLNEFDCLIRSNITVFCASASMDQADRIIMKGQVGLKCAHCCVCKSDTSNFPRSLDDMFQSAHSIGENHLTQCPNLPKAVKDSILKIKLDCGTHPSYFVKKYYSASIKALGIVDTARGLFLSHCFKDELE